MAMTNKNKEIAERCKTALDRADIKLKDLATKVDRSGATITDYLNGSIRIPVTVIATISEISGESLDWLINGKEKAAIADHANPHTALPQTDINLIKQVIEAVMEHLQDNNLDMPPAKIAELVTVLYEEVSETENQQINKGTVIRMIKLAS